MIDVCEHLSCHVAAATMRCPSGLEAFSYSSLQSMGHWSLQIALCMTPGLLLSLNAVIKLFPPQQEVKPRVKLHPVGGEYA